jgi:hypothetical protein
VSDRGRSCCDRFLLAFQLGEHAVDETRVRHPDFPLVLRKLQARADAVDAIAAIASFHTAE